MNFKTTSFDSKILKNIQSLLNCTQIDSFLRKDLSEVFQVHRRSFDGTKAHSP